MATASSSTSTASYFSSSAPSFPNPIPSRPVPSPSQDHRTIKRIYAYAHGFLSNENSFKGRHFQGVFAACDTHLHLLNLNGGDQNSNQNSGLGSISYTGGLAAIQALYEREGGREKGVKLTLLGSSLGGYVAARFAELHPEAVEKLVLFCPGFDLQSRWPRVFGEVGLREWEERGFRDFEGPGGCGSVRVPWSFIEDGRRHPAFPAYGVPTLIIHGLNDDVVPVETTTKGLFGQVGGDGWGGMVKTCTQVLMVNDDHALTKPKTLAVAASSILEFLDIRKEEDNKEGGREEDCVLSMTDHLEVEAKFALPTDRVGFEEKILAAGGELKGAVIFTDIYWDLPGEILSLANVWLRQRSGIWELKVPAVEGEHPNQQPIACYREILGQTDIETWLIAAFPAMLRPLAHLPLGELLDKAGAYHMASYTTERSKYVIPCVGGGEVGGEGTRECQMLSIDVDDASFGFGLVEIEELVASQDDVAAAEKRIKRCAREQLGLHGVEKVMRGKLEEYILRHDPAHHARLVERQVYCNWGG
ncbi:cyth domain-containing protein [Nannochloropsis oceanica]